MIMPENTKPQITAATSKDSLFALWRFLASLAVLCLLAVGDLFSHESVPTMVYLLIGALNGVDSYKLYKEINK